MMSPKAIEAWLTLTTEAMRGRDDAQSALRALSELSNPQEMQKWMSKFMPASVAASSAQPEAFQEWVEDWWRATGVVPRSRYLELLEKCDLLERRLEKAEETIARLRGHKQAVDQQSEEAQKFISLWGSMLQETMKTQAQLMKGWSGQAEEGGGATAEEKKPSEPEGEAPSPPSESDPPQPKTD